MLRINTPGIFVTVPLTLWLGWRYGEAAVDFLLLHAVERPVLTVIATLAVAGLLVWAWRRSAEEEGGAERALEGLPPGAVEMVGACARRCG